MDQIPTGPSPLTKGKTLTDKENKDVTVPAEDPTTSNTTVVAPSNGVEDSEEPETTDSETAEVEYVPAHVAEGGRDYRVEGNDVSGYIGVDPEYMTYANETERPLLTETEKFDYTDQYVGAEEYDPEAEKAEAEKEDGFAAEESSEEEVEAKDPLYPKEDVDPEVKPEDKKGSLIEPNLI